MAPAALVLRPGLVEHRIPGRRIPPELSAISRGVPSDGPWYPVRAFDHPATAPPDLAHSKRYRAQVSALWPHFSLPPGLTEAEAEPIVRRIVPLRHRFRRALLATRDDRGRPFLGVLERERQALLHVPAGRRHGGAPLLGGLSSEYHSLLRRRQPTRRRPLCREPRVGVLVRVHLGDGVRARQGVLSDRYGEVGHAPQVRRRVGRLG